MEPSQSYESSRNTSLIQTPSQSVNRIITAMALSVSHTLPLFTVILVIVVAESQPSDLILTLVNNCPYTVWPAIQPNTGDPVLERGGFPLTTLTHRSFQAPKSHWSGRIWARTGCTYSNNRFSCSTGDCGGRLECDGLGGSPPATLAQISLHHGTHDGVSYGVSIVDGFNVPMTLTPHEGKGQCPVVGCRENLLETCPIGLRFHGLGRSDGPVVGCKSGCEAFGTDELCCRGRFNSKETCKGSTWSEFFKHSCPATFTYAHDSPSLIHECASPRELKVIFCH